MKEHLASLRRSIWPQVIAVVLLYGLGVLTIEGAGSWQSILAVLVLASFIAIAATGQTFVVLIGGIDLSIPGFIALANIATAQLTGDGWPFWIVAPSIIAVSALVGAFNGAVAKWFDINPLIVTLGASAILTGAILVWTGGHPTGYVPKWLNDFVAPSGSTFGLPIPPVLVFWCFLATLVALVLHRTPFGKHIYAVGASQTAARIALVKTTRIWTLAFMLSGIIAAITGILLAGFTTQGDPRIATPYLFNTIAAVVIGGTSLLGARGGYLRTVLGAVILTQITTLLVANRFDAAAQQALLGIIILAVVATYGREQPVRNRL